MTLMEKSSVNYGLNLQDLKFITDNVLKVDFTDLLDSKKELSDSKHRNLNEAILKYNKGVPLEYIAGKSNFFGFDLDITSDVLAPRPETELMVEEILNKGWQNKHIRVADLGTGSGNIGVCLGFYRKLWKIYSVDISFKALNVAKRNKEKYDLSNLFLVNGDMLQCFKNYFFDIVAFNPPYVESDWINSHESLQYEPRVALDGGVNGLKVIYRTLESLSHILKPGGLLFMEIGYKQKDRILKYMKTSNWKIKFIKKDFSGYYRILVCERNGSEQKG